MLGMAFFKSLIKQHGTQFFEPIGKALAASGIKQPNPLNPAHLWALRDVMSPYAKWLMAQYLSPGTSPQLPPMPDALRHHAEFAVHQLQKSPLEISGTMRKHQLKLADRQCRISDLSGRIQRLVVMLCTSLYAARQGDELIRMAADVLCQDLSREYSGGRPTDRYLRTVTALGESIAEGEFRPIAQLQPDKILMPYPQD
jgi:hypothetical protein